LREQARIEDGGGRPAYQLKNVDMDRTKPLEESRETGDYSPHQTTIILPPADLTDSAEMHVASANHRALQEHGRIVSLRNNVNRERLLQPVYL
jgi:hypothetical protein